MTLKDSCEGKVRFETHQLAMKASHRRKKTQRPRTVYRCHACEGYHLGNLMPKAVRNLAKKPRVHQEVE